MSCDHLNEIIDQHSGNYICIDCGLVKDMCLISYEKTIQDEYLDNLTDPISNFAEIFHISKNNVGKNTNVKHLHTKKNLKNVASEIYQSPEQNILLKEIMNVTCLNSKEITSNKIHCVDLIQTIDKYAPFFNVSFKECKSIKNQALYFNNTGYQPLTIIGGLFYLYLKKNNKKLSIKYVSEKLGISSISIQRFSKYFKCNFTEDFNCNVEEVYNSIKDCRPNVVGDLDPFFQA